MIDYSHIPIHIRCTNRHLIDPHYPKDDAAWWRIQLDRKGGNGADMEEKTRVDERYTIANERRERLAAKMREVGMMSSAQVGRFLGVKGDYVRAMLRGMHTKPLFFEQQEEKGKMVWYGLLSDDSNR